MKAKLFKLADYFVIPTTPISGDQEGFPVVFSEAVFYKKEIIASDYFLFPSEYSPIVYLSHSSPNAWITYFNSKI